MTDDLRAARSRRRRGLRIVTFKSVHLRCFRRSSPNQEVLLPANDEDDWSRFVDDPLPPVAGLLPGQRLRDTVKNVNRTIPPRLIRFSTDGSGRGSSRAT